MSAKKSIGKQISYRDIIGDSGIALIHTIVNGMGFVWNETRLEAGIDGYIEIRDPDTSRITNLIIQVQSKATEQDFKADTPSGFDYYCDQRDLDYWLSGNAPVILVCSRPSTKEAYWVSVKDYFRDLQSLASRKIHFDKVENKFDVDSRNKLFNLAKPKDSGIYLSSTPKQEKIYSNLLKVESFAEHIYIARTEHRLRGELWGVFNQMGVDVGDEWILKNQQIISFHNLEEYPWSKICDQETIERYSTEEWLNSDDNDFIRKFVELLNRTLKQKLLPDVLYQKEWHYYYFAPTAGLSARKFSYQSLSKKTNRTVFQSYPQKGNSNKISYYRHSAFSGRFVQYDGEWYLEITPTYRYTWNGYNWSWKGEELLKRIKRIERNAAVLGQVIMWAEYLKQKGDMFTTQYPFLSFGTLYSFDLNIGISDEEWLPNDASEETEAVKSSSNQPLLFNLTKD